ncbi:MAG: type II toxin-antitoxin system HicA family toxin [Gammaproteobacteria bacterium]|nr:type II toxin-antitoxin system HicA family toxin [Gammaproteobacteria bacterium]
MGRERDSRKIIRRLKRDGWTHLRTSGSHHVFGKGSRRLVIPHPRKDLPIGMVQEIEESAGWKGR